MCVATLTMLLFFITGYHVMPRDFIKIDLLMECFTKQVVMSCFKSSCTAITNNIMKLSFTKFYHQMAWAACMYGLVTGNRCESFLLSNIDLLKKFLKMMPR